MATVTVSPKFQVVIPKEIREQLGIEVGQKVRALVVDGRIELVPLRPMRSYRGSLPGIDTEVPRDEDRS